MVKNNEAFGPTFAGDTPNYRLVIATCPPGCHKTGTIKMFGKAIHPQESSICKAAIADNSVPFFGGVIGVGISKGLLNYDKGGVINGINVLSHKKSQKSFTTFKIDNVDFSE
jgi:hypothetical protein